jgi:hypothetical protein
VSVLVFAIAALFAGVAFALRPRRHARPITANGIPLVVDDDRDHVIVLDRPRRAITEPMRRLARGSVPPPSLRLASLEIALTTSGEFGGELRARAMTPVDEGWTFDDGERERSN